MQVFIIDTISCKILILRLIIPVFFFSFLLGCNEPHRPQAISNTNDSEVLNKEPEPDLNYNSFSNRINSDILQELFDEEVNKTPELQNLVEQIKDMEQLKKDSLADYDGFVQNNSKYITAANDYIDQISDTVLKKDMKKTFSDFETSYEKKVISSKNAMSAINNKTIELNNQLMVLKLLVTKSVMQEYQAKHLPDMRQMNRIQDKYDSLIDETRSYPKKKL